MKNVLVGVTRHKSGDRLIHYGKEVADGTGGDLFVVHVMKYPLTELTKKSAEVLEYLHTRAAECNTTLNLIRSTNSVATLVSLVDRLDIGTLVIGETRKDKPYEDTIQAFLDILCEDCSVIIVPRADT